jgi:hypothetical protein
MKIQFRYDEMGRHMLVIAFISVKRNIVSRL